MREMVWPVRHVLSCEHKPVLCRILERDTFGSFHETELDTLPVDNMIVVRQVDSVHLPNPKNVRPHSQVCSTEYTI
jgi:hypothetical protein